MITLDDLCAHLLPPDDHIKFQSLIIEEPHLILMAAMISANSTCPDLANPYEILCRVLGRDQAVTVKLLRNF